MTFERVPDVTRLAEPATGRLGTAGADVIPAPWLHLTVTDIGPADEIDRSARAALATAVRTPLACELGVPRQPPLQIAEARGRQKELVELPMDGDEARSLG